MATGEQAVTRIARDTLLSRSAIWVRSRVLKQNDGGWWPRGGPGGGKNSAHVHPHHLMALACTLADDRPATEAVESVEDIGGMSCMYAINITSGPVTDLVNHWKRQIGAPWPDLSDAATMEAARQPLQGHPAFRAIPGATVLEAGANLIDWMSRPEGQALREYWTRTGALVFTVTRHSGYDTRAMIWYNEENPREGFRHEAASTYHDPKLPLGSRIEETKDYTYATIQRTAKLNIYLFLAMADLWADTRARTGATWPPSKPTPASVGDDAHPNAHPRDEKTGGTAIPPASCAGQSSGQPTGQRTAQRNSEHPIKPGFANQRSLDLSADRTHPLDAGGSEDVRRLDDAGNRARRREDHPRRAFA